MLAGGKQHTATGLAAAGLGDAVVGNGGCVFEQETQKRGKAACVRGGEGGRPTGQGSSGYAGGAAQRAGERRRWLMVLGGGCAKIEDPIKERGGVINGKGTKEKRRLAYQTNGGGTGMPTAAARARRLDGYGATRTQ